MIETNRSQANIGTKAIALLAVFLPIFFFCAVAWRYCDNIPWFDDFDAFPIFLHQFINADSFFDKWSEIVKPNNEHRMVFGKLATVGYYFITKTLNFRFLQAVGICFTLGTFVIFFKSLKRAELSLWFLVPISLLLFQFEHYLVYGWSICGLQHQPVIFFITLTAYLLSRQYFYWAIVAAICANFSMSNGNLVWVVGAGILLLQYQYKNLGLWIAVGLLMIYFYLHGITAMGNESSIPYIIQHPILTILGFFTFLGGILDILPSYPLNFRIVLPIIGGILGILSIIVWWIMLLRNWLKHNSKSAKIHSELQLFVFGVSIFLIVNALIIAFLRPRFGFMVMVVSNYKLYPALFFITIYVAFLTNYKSLKSKKTILVTSILISLGIWIFSSVHYINEFSERSKSLVINAYNQVYNGTGLGLPPNNHYSQHIDAVMNELSQNNIYKYPTSYTPIVEAIKHNFQKKFPNQPVIYNTDKNIIITQQSKAHFNAQDGAVYIYFKSEKNLYIFKMDPVPYQGKNIFRTYRDNVQFTIDDYSNSFLSGQYLLGFVKVENSQIEAGQYGPINIPKFK